MNILKKLQPGIETLKQFDAYSKPIEDFRVKTISGGTASVICWLLIFVLLTKRFYEFAFHNETVETIFVDTSRGGAQLRINIDFIIPSVSCDYLALDAMDSSGEQHLQIHHNIYKRRLDLSGHPIEEPKKEESLGKGAKDDTAVAVQKCGSCYGAENPEQNITCCNTCEEVRHAYQLKRWELRDIDRVEQCQSSHDAEKISKALKEGCQIYGYMEVNRVGGSFHIAPGESFTINHIHVHDVQPFSSSIFNTSHTIRHLSFGNVKIIGKDNPLDNSESIAVEGSTMYQYYLKIVPTMRVLQNGSKFLTNQFSVTKHSKVVSPGSGDSGMPGIFFSYELSALMVKISDKVVPWSHFFNECCSCIGGVFIVFMLLDSFFYRSVILWKKMEIGKAH